MQLHLFSAGSSCAVVDHRSPRSNDAPSAPRTGHRPVVPCTRRALADEQDSILAALRTRTVDGFLRLAEPVVTSVEWRALDTCKGLPWQIVHHVVAPVVERLTRRWAEIQDWPPFATVMEPAVRIGTRGPRVLTLRLERPSRGLQGTIAFQVHRRIEHVPTPIPLTCLDLLRELHEQGCPFRAVAYLMPMWAGRGASRTLLRSQDECRYARARALDPLLVGWLGDGPLADMRLPAFVPHGLIRATVERRPVAHRSFVFCIGHWD